MNEDALLYLIENGYYARLVKGKHKELDLLFMFFTYVYSLCSIVRLLLFEYLFKLFSHNINHRNHENI